MRASEEGGSGGGAEESSHRTTRLGIYIFKEVDLDLKGRSKVVALCSL